MEEWDHHSGWVSFFFFFYLNSYKNYKADSRFDRSGEYIYRFYALKYNKNDYFSFSPEAGIFFTISGSGTFRFVSDRAIFIVLPNTFPLSYAYVRFPHCTSNVRKCFSKEIHDFVIVESFENGLIIVIATFWAFSLMHQTHHLTLIIILHGSTRRIRRNKRK